MKHSFKEHITITAPARICLFGDHQDYLGLPVIACAIDRKITLKATINHKEVFRVSLPDIGKKREIPIKFSTTLEEGDYLLSALHVLKRKGCLPLIGYDIEIFGDIPINAGLSSSSAVLVAWVSFLLEAFYEGKITPELIASTAYEAEVLEFNAPGGLMDQYSISLGKIVFLDTVTGNYEYLGNDFNTLIIGESGVAKETLGVLGNLRGLATLAINQVKQYCPSFNIYNTTREDFNKYKKYIEPNLEPYLFAAIENYHITKKAKEEFKKPNCSVSEIGKLMNAHHAVLKNILKITVPLIDNMVGASLQSGAYGAKIVGSGGGGCIVALANKENASTIVESILKSGAKNAYVVNVSNGVKSIIDA